VASAPGGADSSATFTIGGAGLKESRESDEQAGEARSGDGNPDDTMHGRSL
jgi:hypothetical protein